MHVQLFLLLEPVHAVADGNPCGGRSARTGTGVFFGPSQIAAANVIQLVSS